MDYVILVAGFAVLIGAGDLLVRGATALALRFGVPALIVGLTVVAFGTSAPELVVSVRAALDGAAGIAVGNIVGSNIANVLLVLALPALVASIDCREPRVRRNTVYMLAASCLFIALAFMGPLGFWQGALLFSLLLLFLATSANGAVNGRAEENETLPAPDGFQSLPHSWWMTAGFIVAGLVGLPVAAGFVVHGASEIARQFGIGEAAIGLTLVAFGTSLPELSTTMMAAIRGQGGIVIGNVIGSNLFNLLGIMGITAMFAEVAVPAEMLRFDLWVMLAASLLIVPLAFRNAPLTRTPAALLVGAYCAYVAFELTSGGHGSLPAPAGLESNAPGSRQ